HAQTVDRVALRGAGAARVRRGRQRGADPRLDRAPAGLSVGSRPGGQSSSAAERRAATGRLRLPGLRAPGRDRPRERDPRRRRPRLRAGRQARAHPPLYPQGAAPAARTLVLRPVAAMKVRLGHSPDPDDAFMFWGLAEGEVDPRGFEFEHVLRDIQTLNEWALEGRLEVTAISLHAYPLVQDRYVLLPHGASMGSGYGPIVVARGALADDDLRRIEIAVPGRMTTAFLALKLR